MAIQRLTDCDLIRLNTDGLQTRGFTYTYPTLSSIYTVSISAGYFPGHKFYNSNATTVLAGPNKKITRIVSYGILQSATNLDYAWGFSSRLSSLPINGNLGNCKSFTQTWYGCNGLSSFPQTNVSKGETFTGTWGFCRNLRDFPSLNFSSAKQFGPGIAISGTWYECTVLSGFGAPTNTTNLTALNYTWYRCFGLRSFPFFDTSNVTVWNGAWNLCTNLSSFPSLDTSKGQTFTSTWQSCFNLSSFPSLDFSNATSLARAWDSCQNLRTFPTINTLKVTTLEGTWEGQSITMLLNTFPSLTTPLLTGFGTVFGGASRTWTNCSFLTSFGALSCPLNNVFFSTWENCYGLSTVNGFNFYPDTFRSMTNGTNCFLNVTLPTQTWSSILTSICAININSNVSFHGGNSKRNTAGHTATVHLTGVRNWSITDGGRA